MPRSITERGHLVGVLEDADLFAAQPRSWFGARRAIARARNLDALAEAAAGLPQLMLELHASSVPALELARVLSALADALCERALDLAGADPGLVYVAVGSQARRELTPGSTWRGALVATPHDEAGDEPDAQLGTAGLQAIEAALVRCGVQPPVAVRPAARLVRAGPGRASWRCPCSPTAACCGARRRRRCRRRPMDATRSCPRSPRWPSGMPRRPGLTPTACSRSPGASASSTSARRRSCRSRRSGPGRRRPPTSSAARRPSGWPARPPRACSAPTRPRPCPRRSSWRSSCGSSTTSISWPPGARSTISSTSTALTPLTRDRLRDVFRAVNAVAGELRP